MSSSLCNNPVLAALTAAAGGAVSTAAREATTVASAAREARSLAAWSNAASLRGRRLSGDDRLQGLRNRLFLKYIGVDFEFYNTRDMRYRSTAV